jgi:hypothetical protein
MRPRLPFMANDTSPSQELRRIRIFEGQTLAFFLGRNLLQFTQGQTGNASAKWTPVTLADLRRCGTPTVIR